MADWKTHLMLANKINKDSLNFKDENFQKFLWGNIAPDINNNHLIIPVHTIKHSKTHYMELGQIDGLINFYNENKELILQKEPFVLGYFFHLWVDIKLNWDFFSILSIYDIVEKGEMVQRKKWNDVSLYTKINSNKITIPENNNLENIIKCSKQINRINIHKEDLEKCFDFFNKNGNCEDIYVIYDEKRMNWIMQQITETFIDFFNKIDNLK